MHSSAPTPVDSNVLRKKEQEIERLKSEQQWMIVALQNAKKRGFEFEEAGQTQGEERLRALGGGNGEDGDEKRELVQMLLAMKSELAKAKVSPDPDLRGYRTC
jgi:hypothetical protein